jgi:hypothetical protein
MPNPFEQLPSAVSINILGMLIEIPPNLLNMLAESPIYTITFMTVGLYYIKGIDSPVKGSFLYLVFYCMHIMVLSIMAKFQFSIVVIILVIACYIGCHVGISILKNRMSS